MATDLPAGIVPATAGMAVALGTRLRREHERESNAMIPLGGRRALALAFATASVCYAGVRDGRLLFLVGVGRTAESTGAAVGWLMGTADMDRYGVWIADISRVMLPRLHRESGAARIHNWIPYDYRDALRWLAWLEFEIGPPEPAYNGVPHVYVFHHGPSRPDGRVP